MKIRQKILVYFSVLALSLSGGSFILIYTLFSNNRTDEFRQRIKDKTFTKLKFLVEVQQIDYEMLRTIDRNTINNLYEEKTLIYDHEQKLIYQSLSDTKIDAPEKILEQINSTGQQIDFEESGFDVVGVTFEFEGQKYYGIAKAYDEYGLSKLKYLRYVLIMIFMLISAMILVSSYLLSRQISQPINQMTTEIGELDFESGGHYLTLASRKDEIGHLARRFNELLKRLTDSFSFQKHVIDHISHELKTPIAALVSNLERLEEEQHTEKLKMGLKRQKEDTKKLGDIINTLLELSKVESRNKIDIEHVRVDDLIFDVMAEYRILEENFTFTVEVDEKIMNESNLTVPCNRKLIRLALMNLVNNCAQYSDNGTATISLSNKDGYLNIAFISTGDIVPVEERQFIFQRFYRGLNSKGKSGFGLGLVLTGKILQLHKGYITYASPDDNTNVFHMGLPLTITSKPVD
jgi:signal transduction histidine kinase